MIHRVIHCSSSHWNVQTLGFSIMGDFSYELPSQPAIDAAAQASFHFDDTFSANQIKIAR